MTIDLTPEAFRAAGYRAVDHIAALLESLPQRPVMPEREPSVIRAQLGDSLPEEGMDAEELVDWIAPLLTEHSGFNGHPRFFGYITSSATPIGAIADLLAAGINPNLALFRLAPIATEIERQAVEWTGRLIGYSTEGGGILSSGGTMANFLGLAAARAAKLDYDVRKEGIRDRRPRVYLSAEAHHCHDKTIDLLGLGTDALRRVPVDAHLRMDARALRRMIAEDRAAGLQPIIVIGTAGTVGTGAVDPLDELAAIAVEEGLWFHVDGAYGAFAVVAPSAPPELRGLSQADSLALDPHKWLYIPLEAGCTLMRDPYALQRAFSYEAEYLREDKTRYAEQRVDFTEYGLQNSRGFRALKVWMSLRQIGARGYRERIGRDMELAQQLGRLVEAHPELELLTPVSLSICAFRYRPQGVPEEKLNALNQAVLERVWSREKVFPSNTLVDGKFALRACIVNFRTEAPDLEVLIDEAVSAGRSLMSA